MIEMKNITVVCVSTGTKCINGGHISMNGASLNDCHAEIISRRCFKSYLYSQLELLTGSSAQDSIFIKKEDNWYGLKPNVKFHLFISTSPCGDARIFCPKEDHVDKHPNRKARGVMRTKIDGSLEPEKMIDSKDGEVKIEEPMEVDPPLKRKATEDGPKKRKKRATQSNMVKTPLMQLNELKPGLVFTADGQEGLPHEPIFLVSVEVNNQKFHGRGSSKQQAKHAAANEALKSFVQFQDMADVGRSVANSIACWDFTSDIVDNEQAIFNKFEKNAPPQVRTDIVSKHPVMLLNELYPGSYYELLKEHPNHPGQRFTMKVTVGDKIFEGSGTNKKLAKAAAARAAICEILKVNYSATEPATVTDEVHNLPQTIADNIARAIYDKFNQIMEGNPNQAKWKVLAGIAMTTDSILVRSTPLALRLGCLSTWSSLGQNILASPQGEVLMKRWNLTLGFRPYQLSSFLMKMESWAEDPVRSSSWE
ncbi:ADARB1 [Cordylochernes scorpioides]|uniref:ADARB1 n=1 Tax=Cordylochernes scorpioides TaxID=51811 RepID=A0ABY6LUG9_9ARAC|nr:ADARB1 [Cordylochernes scorpioides]